MLASGFPAAEGSSSPNSNDGKWVLIQSLQPSSSEAKGSSSTDPVQSTSGMGFESSRNKGQMYTGMEPSNHNHHHRPNNRKASIKQAWEESYALKTEELRAEERRHSSTNNSRAASQNSIVSERVSVVHRPAPFSVRRLMHIFKSKRFSDNNLEALYRRYFIKVDQSSMSVMNVICIILCLMLIAFAYGSGHESALRGIVLGIIVVLFTILEVLLYRLNLEFGAQQVLCYMSLLLLLGVICTISLDHNPAAVDDGLWVTVVFVYMVYTGIPVSMSVALLTGILLPVLQVALTSRFLLRPADSKSEVRLGSY